MSSSKAIRSNGTFRAERRGRFVFVAPLESAMEHVNATFPHAGLNQAMPITFTFRHDNGEMIDYEPSTLLAHADALAIKDLSIRARDFARSVKLIEPRG